MKGKPRLIFIIFLSSILIWFINLIWYKPFFIELYFDRLFVEYGFRHPEMLTSAHVLENYGINAHNRELNNISLEYRQQTFEEITKAFEMLRSYKRNKLDKEEQLSHDVLDFYFEKIIFSQQFFQHEIPFDHLEGIQVALPVFLMEHQTVKNLQDAEHYLERVSKISDKVYQYIQAIMLKDEGDKPPKYVFEYMIDQIDCFLTAEITQNLVYKDFKKKIENANLINPDAKSELLYNIKLEIGDNVYPAFKELHKKLEIEKEYAPDQAGIWQYNDGDAYYYLLLNESLTIDTSMYDLEDGSLAEINRLHKKIAKKLNVDQVQVKEELQKLSLKSKEPNSNDASKFQILKEHAKNILLENSGLADAENLAIKQIMPFSANYRLTEYIPASLDGHRSATLLVSDYLFGFLPSHMLKGLVIAEVSPGRHFITEKIRSAQKLPSIRKVIDFNVYTEGWKYYVLENATRLGMINSDLEEVGCLQWQLLYASLSVADLRIHQNMFTRQEAIDFIMAETGLPRPLVLTYVDKAIVKPAKAPAYLVGFKAFTDLNHSLFSDKADGQMQIFMKNASRMASYGKVPVKFFPLLDPENAVENNSILAGSSAR